MALLALNELLQKYVPYECIRSTLNPFIVSCSMTIRGRVHPYASRQQWRLPNLWLYKSLADLHPQLVCFHTKPLRVRVLLCQLRRLRECIKAVACGLLVCFMVFYFGRMLICDTPKWNTVEILDLDAFGITGWAVWDNRLVCKRQPSQLRYRAFAVVT